MGSMVVLVIVLAAGLWTAVRLGEAVPFLVGGGIAAAFIALAVPHIHALGGH